MKNAVLALVFVSIAGSAFAVADPDPDGIGIWFELSADTNVVEVPLFGMVDVFLVISNPTAVSIGGWECSLEFDTNAALNVTGWIFNGGGIWIPQDPYFSVGLPAPLPAETATWMMTFTAMMIEPQGTTFLVGPYETPSVPENLPIYVDGEDLTNFILLRNSTGYGPGGEILPCAAINADLQYSATRDLSWGAVKNLW